MMAKTNLQEILKGKAQGAKTSHSRRGLRLGGEPLDEVGEITIKSEVTGDKVQEYVLKEASEGA